MKWCSGDSPEVLSDHFVEYNKNGALRMPQRQEGIFRVATFNVHFFLDCRGVPNVEKILEEICELESELLVLNEFFPLPHAHGLSSKDAESLAKSLRERIIACGYIEDSYESSPSWEKGISWFANMCFSQSLKATFVTVIFSKAKMLMLKQVTVEDRHCVFVKLDNGISLWGVHLDVYDESGKLRRKQAKIMLEKCDKDDFVIIAGDMNAMRRKDYSEEEIEKIRSHDTMRNVCPDFETVELIESNGFVDSFEMCKKKSPNCRYRIFLFDLSDFSSFFLASTWSGRRVDFVFLRNIAKSDWIIEESYIVNTNNSGK